MKTRFWIILTAAILVLSAVASGALLLPGEQAVWAEIRSAGELNQTVNLRMDQEFTVPCPGGYNTVTVKDGRIAVTEASCPDQYCVRQGFCNSGRDIVCLPNVLVISFLGEQEIDGQIG